MKQGPYVNFKLAIPDPKSKKITKDWIVTSVSGTTLGQVSWWTAWRRYVYLSAPDMLYDANCLWDIADFCARMTKEQKEDQAKRRDER
jgi:hypothetical protein